MLIISVIMTDNLLKTSRLDRKFLANILYILYIGNGTVDCFSSSGTEYLRLRSTGFPVLNNVNLIIKSLSQVFIFSAPFSTNIQCYMHFHNEIFSRT